MSEHAPDEAPSSPKPTSTPSEGTRKIAYVPDASALLCLINDEPGSARVAATLPSSAISAVNLAEVATKLNELGADAEEARALLAPLHLAAASFDEREAHATGALRVATRGQGLSLGRDAIRRKDGGSAEAAPAWKPSLGLKGTTAGCPVARSGPSTAKANHKLS